MLINPIIIKNLAVDCVIGIHAWERTSPQKIFLDIKCFFDFAPVLKSHSIKDTINYVTISQLAQELLVEKKYHLLETFAGDFAETIFAQYPCTSVEVTVKKPTPDVANANYVGVQFKMGRQSPLPTSLNPKNILPGDADFLKDKVMVITGAAKGLGRAMAEHFSKKGCKLALHYWKSQEETHALANTLRKDTPSVKVYGGKLSSHADMKAMAHSIGKDFGRVDFLINNVGAYNAQGLFEISPEDFEHVITTNICGTYFLSREVLPYMQKNDFGRIVNIGQVSAERIRAWLQETPYHMSKTALLTLTKSIARSLAGSGITCNMVSPGIMANNTHFPPDFYKQMPMGRLAQFSDLISAVQFLLAPDSEYITGTNIDVAGGYGL